ncbi:MAG: hypothetical protein WCA12_20020, partial [Burkholderiales bacterium]
DAAFEITAELPFHVRGHPVGVEVPLAGEREIGLEMALDGAVERRALGAAPAVDLPSPRRRVSGALLMALPGGSG